MRYDGCKVHRVALLGILAMFALAPAFATGPPDVRIDAVLEGSGIACAANLDDVAAETIWMYRPET